MRVAGSFPCRVFPVGVLLLSGLLVCGCDKKEKRPDRDAGGKFAISRKYERGPCMVLLLVDRKEITIAGHVRLVLRALVGQGVEVELPRFGDKLDRFSITDFRTPPPRAAARGRMLYEREYTLEPFLSGAYEIGAMTVRFKTAHDGKWHELATTPVKIMVKSLLPKEGGKLVWRDIAGPVAMPPADHAWLYALALPGLLAAAGAGILVYRRLRGGKARAESTESAFERARRELALLLREDLPGKERVKEFYQRLSDILRRYIEARFGLRAPERTTEEFLADLERDERLAAGHKRLLREFLRHCDLVKFAALRPGRDQIQAAFDACRRFLEETAAPARQDAPAGPGGTATGDDAGEAACGTPAAPGEDAA